MGLVAEKLAVLRSRGISFRLLGHLLRESDIPTTTGWDSLIKKNENDPVDPEIKQSWISTLKKIHKDHVLFGDKAVAIFSIAKEAHARVIASGVEALVDSTSPFGANFPKPLDESELTSVSSNPVATRFDRLPSGVLRLVYCAKRYVRSREEMNVADLDEEIRGAFSGYQEIVGIRTGYVQRYDIVQFNPAARSLEIQLDTSLPLTSAEIALLLRYYEELMQSWARELIGVASLFGKPKNFLPLVRQLYDAPDGCVDSLGHSTASASIKDERMRRKNTDLRQEPFHLGGLAGVSNLTSLYSISKSWDGFSPYSKPSVVIPGHFSCVGIPGARVEYVLVNGCTCSADFRMVLSKL